MPVRRLPSHPHIDHLRYQAKDLLKSHVARSAEAAQRLREFHPRCHGLSDADIFALQLKLNDAQLAIAREHGFASWTRLKAQVEKPAVRLDLPHHERIQDRTFRCAVDLLDAGDVDGLRVWIKDHPQLVHQRVEFEGENYFRSPALLEFVAENPIRHGTLPPNIVEVARAILDAGASASSVNETLGLVATGRVARDCGVQTPLIDLLCAQGADPSPAARAAAGHGEFAAVQALIRHGARVDLPLAAAMGSMEDFRRLLPQSSKEDRHLALAFGAQFGHAEVVRLLLDAGEDPNRYNPSHSHSTPLHQAAYAGHEEVVRLLLEHGARLDIKDVLWHGTAADWAQHAGRKEIEAYLRSQEPSRSQEPDGQKD